jgi:hypothetical protein
LHSIQIYTSYVGDGPASNGDLRPSLLYVPLAITGALLLLGFLFIFFTRSAL